MDYAGSFQQIELQSNWVQLMQGLLEASTVGEMTTLDFSRMVDLVQGCLEKAQTEREKQKNVDEAVEAALDAVYLENNKFDGYDGDGYLGCYRSEMQLRGVPDERMIKELERLVSLDLWEQIQEVSQTYGECWEYFEEAVLHVGAQHMAAELQEEVDSAKSSTHQEDQPFVPKAGWYDDLWEQICANIKAKKDVELLQCNPNVEPCNDEEDGLALKTIVEDTFAQVKEVLENQIEVETSSLAMMVMVSDAFAFDSGLGKDTGQDGAHYGSYGCTLVVDDECQLLVEDEYDFSSFCSEGMQEDVDSFGVFGNCICSNDAMKRDIDAIFTIHAEPCAIAIQKYLMEGDKTEELLLSHVIPMHDVNDESSFSYQTEGFEDSLALEEDVELLALLDEAIEGFLTPTEKGMTQWKVTSGVMQQNPEDDEELMRLLDETLADFLPCITTIQTHMQVTSRVGAPIGLLSYDHSFDASRAEANFPIFIPWLEMPSYLLQTYDPGGKVDVCNYMGWWSDTMSVLCACLMPFDPGGKQFTWDRRYGYKGDSPDIVTYMYILRACGSIGDLEEWLQMHIEATKRGLDGEIFVGNTLVDMYAKNKALDEAQAIFDKLIVRNVVAWTSLIAGFAEGGYNEQVLSYYTRMQEENVTADAVTFIHGLKACGTRGALEKGQEIHAKVKESGLENDLVMWNALLDMYGKCGSTVEAQELFDRMPVRDIVSWNTLIQAYGENQKSLMAMQCFKDMQEHGVKPDAATFVCLLIACSHGSLVDKGQELFRMMTEKYGIKPIAHHYSCMADLLARSGHVFEALSYAEALQPDIPKEILMVLLTGCKVYGKVELAERCFEQFIQKNPEVAAAYRLMADIYAMCCRWDDMQRVEEMREQAKAEKKLAIASVEVNKTLHQFIVGDTGSTEMSMQMDMLSMRMRDQGYVPNVDSIFKY